MDYNVIPDEELVERYKRGENEAINVIISRYDRYIRSKTRKYFFPDGDKEDIAQTATIGLFIAITSYKGTGPFKNYAMCCIKNSIISAIRKSNTNANKPLNNYVSIFAGDGDDKTDIVSDREIDPEITYINNEIAEELKERIKETLSKYEYKILGYYLQGYSYKEISEVTGKTPKSIDNAIQRIKRKINDEIVKKD